VLTSLPSQFVYLGVYEHATTVIERSFPDHHNSNSAMRRKEGHYYYFFLAQWETHKSE